MFKVNNENTRTTSMTLFSTVSIVYFEQVKVSWVNTLLVHIRHVIRNFCRYCTFVLTLFCFWWFIMKKRGITLTAALTLTLRGYESAIALNFSGQEPLGRFLKIGALQKLGHFFNFWKSKPNIDQRWIIWK